MAKGPEQGKKVEPAANIEEVHNIVVVAMLAWAEML